MTIKRLYKFKAAKHGAHNYPGVRVERFKWIVGRWRLWDSHWAEFRGGPGKAITRARAVARALNAPWDG